MYLTSLGEYHCNLEFHCKNINKVSLRKLILCCDLLTAKYTAMQYRYLLFLKAFNKTSY